MQVTLFSMLILWASYCLAAPPRRDKEIISNPYWPLRDGMMKWPAVFSKLNLASKNSITTIQNFEIWVDNTVLPWMRKNGNDKRLHDFLGNLYDEQLDFYQALRGVTLDIDNFVGYISAFIPWHRAVLKYWIEYAIIDRDSTKAEYITEEDEALWAKIVFWEEELDIWNLPLEQPHPDAHANKLSLLSLLMQRSPGQKSCFVSGMFSCPVGMLLDDEPSSGGSGSPAAYADSRVVYLPARLGIPPVTRSLSHSKESLSLLQAMFFNM
ncbi:hypothetical protein SeLEV6574_g06894 [Synchytrium endobioticum]|uniref:Tyrosinase copper-binding domain-containing protein n=1 Tax=Synchytrium endobioticum TaxID=286115 RepID=A0A507CEM3_9FUNG|nr:hypothetical protein SeLEV6574_g06894 [Synchytrium endobioticum]